jgi:hypothetical protein
LLKMIALADLHLGKGAVSECRRILEGYWPEFLRRHVSPDATALAAAPSGLAGSAGSSSAPDQDNKDKPKATTSWLDRFLPKSPKLPKLVR